MTKRLVCVECPEGCLLNVDIRDEKVIAVTGNKCPKGEKYAAREMENPVRILTSTVLTEGLSLRMIPVRTDRPIPKKDIFKAMRRIKDTRITRPVSAGDIIIKNIADSGADLISTRECPL
ncbi:MAG: DUF1667 domain-containing protein [Candidatus Omnitrophota bacterium]